jgi:hypothetical protein
MPPVNEFASVMSPFSRKKINIIILNKLIFKLKAFMIIKRLIIKNIDQSKSIKLKIFKDFKKLNFYEFQTFKYLFPLKLIENFTKESTLLEILYPNQNSQI